MSERTSERGALRGGASSASLAESGGSRASIAQREEDVPDEWDAASSASEDGRDDTGAEDGADESTERFVLTCPRHLPLLEYLNYTPRLPDTTSMSPLGYDGYGLSA